MSSNEGAANPLAELFRDQRSPPSVSLLHLTDYDGDEFVGHAGDGDLPRDLPVLWLQVVAGGEEKAVDPRRVCFRRKRYALRVRGADLAEVWPDGGWELFFVNLDCGDVDSFFKFVLAPKGYEHPALRASREEWSLFRSCAPEEALFREMTRGQNVVRLLADAHKQCSESARKKYGDTHVMHCHVGVLLPRPLSGWLVPTPYLLHGDVSDAEGFPSMMVDGRRVLFDTRRNPWLSQLLGQRRTGGGGSAQG